MPLEVEMRIAADDAVRTLYEVTERMDYRELTATYKQRPRRTEASPKQLFQIVLLGILNRQFSTRRIEEACRNDIRFMYLLSGKRAPDHCKISRFIREHLQGEVAEGLFYQLVMLLEEQGEICFAHLFADGTKIAANANRYSFVWAKSTSRYEARVDEKLLALQESLLRTYGLVCETPQAYLEVLREVKESRGLCFVHGRGKRKSQLQRDIEALENLLSRKEKYGRYKDTLRGRNSFSKTDPDATFMRMKEDHMRNGQLKAGYNLQLGVEGEYIVGVSLSPDRADEWALLPLLERMDAGTGKRHKDITLDAGYESEENYKRLAGREQIAYIKPQNYEKSKTRKYRHNAFLRDNMPYDAGTDTYTCPAGHTFLSQYETTRKSKSGFEAMLTVYECFGCGGCPQKALCTRAKGNRKLYVSKDFLALRQASLERISSEKGKQLRLNRSIQAEGAFGVLKQDFGFRRFLRRGHRYVFTEVLLYAMAYNLSKLHAKMIRQQMGYTLHLLSSA